MKADTSLLRLAVGLALFILAVSCISFVSEHFTMSLFPGSSPSTSPLKHFVNIKSPFDSTYFVICTFGIVQWSSGNDVITINLKFLVMTFKSRKHRF